jgi:hypothetical protein
VETQIQSSQSLEKQEASIGKALWHQVTTVVKIWDKINNLRKITNFEQH